MRLEKAVSVTVNGRQPIVRRRPTKRLSSSPRRSGRIEVKSLACEKGDGGALAVQIDGEPVDSRLETVQVRPSLAAWSRHWTALNDKDAPHPLIAEMCRSASAEPAPSGTAELHLERALVRWRRVELAHVSLELVQPVAPERTNTCAESCTLQKLQLVGNRPVRDR